MFGLKKSSPPSQPASPPRGKSQEELYAEQTFEILESLSKDMDDRWGLGGRTGETSEKRIYNPSLLVGRKGLVVYDDMLRLDGQIKNSYFLRRLCLLATARTVVPEDPDDPDAVEQQQFIEHCFTEMQGSVESFILKISDAIRCGYKIAEINYRYIEEGDFKGKVGLASLKVRNSRNYEFVTDEHGNILPDGLIEGVGCGNERRLPIEKFIIWTYGGLDDDGASLYGASEFEAAYRYYYGNDIIHRVWSAMCERYVKPLVTAEEQDSPVAPDDTLVTGLLTKIKNLHRRAGLWVPKWAKITVQKSPGGNNSQCREYMDFNNQMISKALLLGTLIQQEGDKSGSYALGKKQFDLFYLNNAQIMRQLEQDVFLEQIIKRLIRMNFDKPRYPMFKLVEPMDPDEMRARAAVLEILAKIPWIEIDEELVRELVGLKQAIQRKAIPAGQKEKSSSLESDDDEGGGKVDGEKTKKEPAAKATISEEYAELNREILPQEKVVDFREVARTLDQIPYNASAGMVTAYQRSADSILSQAEKKGLFLNGGDYSVIPKIIVNPGEFKKVYSTLLTSGYVAGVKAVDSEIKKAAELQGIMFAMPPRPPVGAVISEEYLRTINELSPLKVADLEAIAARLEHESFIAAGAEADSWRTQSRYLMTQAIDQGWSVARFGDDLKALALSRAQRAGLEAGLETETARVYNSARMEMFKAHDEITGWMWSSILDDRTTEFCREMDGMMFRKDSNQPEPPAHFRCRSIPTPVFRFDQPAEWDEPPQGLEPAEGFGGPVGSRVKPAPKSMEHPG